jgi:glycosyltransferase involved in cell wall biosynthesis
VKHLFIIPSWYPHRPCFPFEGLYLREQAEAIGQVHPEMNVTLSLWDQGRGDWSLGHLRRSPGCVLLPLAARPIENALAKNVIEQRKPVRTWNPKRFGGNRQGLLAANRRNLERATTRWGAPEILHAHVSYPAGWIAMTLSRERSIPYVITEHMGPFPLPYYTMGDGSLNPLLREPLERADATIAVSPTTAAQVAAFGLPAPRFIPNLVDDSRYHAAPARTDPRFTFLTMSALNDEKGIGDLLEAIALLRRSVPPSDAARLRFRIVGKKEDAARYEASAARLGIADLIEWPGFLGRDEAPAEFQACDCYVMPSHHESFGIVLAEALACGRPLIATRSGGPEAIVNEGNGLLVPVQRPDELARAMEVMLRRARGFDPGALRAEFMARYSRPAVVGALDAVYADVLARAATRPRR